MNVGLCLFSGQVHNCRKACDNTSCNRPGRFFSQTCPDKVKMENFLAILETRSRFFWILIGCALIAGVGLLDFLTGDEVAFSLFYLIPIALLTWLAGWRLGIAASIVSALVWLGTDIASGQPYLPATLYAWNTFIVLGFFVIVVLLLSALREALEHERELAHTDYLTGAVNPRFFFELLQMEIDRSQRYAHPFTIAYIDIDNFKAINDRFGHVTGDRVLCLVVERARQQLRKTDLLARLGGDEFAVLLPETGQESAQIILSKIQSEILSGMQPGNWLVTISIGVLTCINPPLTTQEIIGMVDDLMYSVKHSGKNAIKFSTYSG
jgi:diguanylate cyclase (GGDEF)-like protein